MTISEAIEELYDLKIDVQMSTEHSGTYMYHKVKAIDMGIEALKRCRAYKPPKKVVLDDD